jgi:putative hemolysin
LFQTKSRVHKLAFAFWIAAALVGCTPARTAQPIPTPTPTTQLVPTPTPAGQIANPASQNCVEQGGTLVIQVRGDGGEYGVCVFEDNRQCEEWAMLRGECPVGGIKITGYVTPAAQYCAITGGAYQVTGKSNTDQEQGTCTFKNGQTCDAGDYYAGRCTPNAEAGPSSYDDPFAYCAAVGTVDVPDERYNGPQMPDSIVQAMIRQGIVTADAPPDFQKNAVWRCMDNSVWACHFGANLPCTEKADTSQTPTSAMEDYCKTNPTAEGIPAAVTGRATVYEWRCTDGKPQVVKQLFTSDPQGYLAEFWYELTPE